MTVSRVLRNAPHVAKETRKRVMAAKEALAYSPNPLVSALMSKVRRGQVINSGEVIAFLTSFSDPHSWRTYPSIVRMRNGAEERAGELGYSVQDFWVREPGLSPERLSNILHARGIRGVMVAPSPLDDFRLHLNWSRFAAAAFEYSLLEPTLHRVCTDRYEAVRQSCREIARLGYTRPGFAMRQAEDTRNNNFWLAGLLVEEFAAARRKQVPPLLMDDYDKGAFCRWFERHKPDCILSINDHLIAWIKDLGLRVPRDVGFVHLNLTLDYFGKYSGIDGCIEALGRSAVDVVVGQMNRNEWGLPANPRLIITPGRWREGKTLRRVKMSG